jgi:hypothetical protein
MKKSLFVVAALVAISFSSCRKDRTCECTSTEDIGGTTYTTVSVTTAKSNKKDATAWCEAGPKTTSTTNGVSNPSDPTPPTCKIK